MWPYLRPYRCTLLLALAAMIGETVLDWPMGLAAVALTLPTAVYARRNTMVMRSWSRAVRPLRELLSGALAPAVEPNGELAPVPTR
jgi:hypothetical protein